LHSTAQQHPRPRLAAAVTPLQAQIWSILALPLELHLQEKEKTSANEKLRKA
jgi:hypothetical protein